MTTNSERATEAQLLAYASGIVADLDELTEVTRKHHRAAMAVDGDFVACQVEVLRQPPKRAAGVVSGETAKNYIAMVRLLLGDAGVAQRAGCFHILKGAGAAEWTRNAARDDALRIIGVGIAPGGGGADAD